MSILSILSEIATERERQVTVEGHTHASDDTYTDGELGMAAAAYALPDVDRQEYMPNRFLPVRLHCWPWKSGFKPTSRRRDLVKAGALIVAEIQRLDRAGGR